MPIYSYQFPDGSTEDKLFKASERPQTIVREDGSVGHFFIAPVARLQRNWSTCANYGVNGVYNKTLQTYITSDKHHDQICEQKGLQRVRTTQDFDRITREKEKEIEADKKIEKDMKRYDENLKKCGDIQKAYDETYGQEELEIARKSKSKATNKILERNPAAKHIDFKSLSTEKK